MDTMVLAAVSALVGGGLTFSTSYGNVLYFLVAGLRNVGFWLDGQIGRRFGRATFFYEWLAKPLTCAPCASGWTALALGFWTGHTPLATLAACLAAMGLARFMYVRD